MTAAEQAAEWLRGEIRAGRWPGRLPGVLALAVRYDVAPVTMRAALRLLEADGWLRSQGAGRARVPVVPGDEGSGPRRRLLVMVLPGMRLSDEDAAFQQLLAQLRHDLEADGHICRFSVRSQEELHHDLRRIQRHVAATPADVWVVVGGSRGVLEWFAARDQPSIAIGGACLGVRIASTGMLDLAAFGTAVRRLTGLGHRRILMLWPQSRMRHGGGRQVDILREALAEVGVPLTAYHLPEWTETPDGLRRLLETTFRHTPPTAVIATYGNWMVGVLSYLAGRGLQAPRDLSLVCLNEDKWFAWRSPEIACLRGDDTKIIRRIVRWTNAVSRGREDRKYVAFPQEFHEGGSIGPAPGGS